MKCQKSGIVSKSIVEILLAESYIHELKSNQVQLILDYSGKEFICTNTTWLLLISVAILSTV